MRIRDPRAFRALAHPLRLDLVELLSVAGPTTAAECARRLGSSQASCSFHLRQLAKYGFVEETRTDDPDQRKRFWRLVETDQAWEARDHPAAARELDRVVVEREATRVLDALADPAGEHADAWRSPLLSGLTVPMSPGELDSVWRRIHDLLEPYAERMRGRAEVPGDAAWIRLFLAATPLADDAESSPTDAEGQG
ncbi:helix-turn-helix domain-containing protein [Streptomyces sp. JH002]|uniref:ArsR/SmtB family transcription factor n=1 Tax=Streptomyces sp. JH002 TaxID=2763259 RepID=UPI003D804C81